MSIHKLTAGSGYDYLTRQVAALDGTDKGRTSLATYYTERGETPGVWLGSGMSGVEGLGAGDVVTAEQMRSLFGSGHHPLAAERSATLPTDATVDQHNAAVRLGAPFKVFDHDVSLFRAEVAQRVHAMSSPGADAETSPATASRRAEARTEVAREWFARAYGRSPIDSRELSALVARESRPQTTAVAGFDLTFSPVKSVSTLWALADEATAARVELAHQAAVRDALAFVEHRALFTRLGTNGVRQVDVRGLVATAFTHRDSRAGDPDLHTHVAVSNKVETLDGRWRAVDGRPLYAAAVSASEVYNTSLERHLGEALGLSFATRKADDPAKRPIREVVGIDPELNRAFSKRRASVDHRRSQLVEIFQQRHDRLPDPVETLRLSQQATLETRNAKHAPRTLSEQRHAWHAEAAAVLGSADAVSAMLATCLANRTSPEAGLAGDDVARLARRTVSAIEQARATWTTWHVYAEAQRQVRATTGTAQLSSVNLFHLVDEVIAAVLDQHSVRVSRLPEDDTDAPNTLTEVRRADGTSTYVVAGSTRFTSPGIVAAERRLVDAAGRLGAPVVSPDHLDQALRQARHAGGRLNDGQERLVRDMATSGRRLQLAIAPAGSGKTTAMETLATAWRLGGGPVVGLAPSAAAADALRRSLSSIGNGPAVTHTDTLAKLVHATSAGTSGPPWLDDIGARALVIIDEAGMADTPSLDSAIRFLLERGATVRLVGDDQQLAAIGAGGVLRDIKTTHGALHLDELVRFVDPAEGSASLALRDGRPEALGFYLDQQRVHVGDVGTVTAQVFDSWQVDRAAGLDALMLAPTRALVADLNHRARESRLASLPAAVTAMRGRSTYVDLSDGNRAGVGDTVVTRTNDRRLPAGPRDWVKNGDRWLVTGLVPDREGTRLAVRHLGNGQTAVLPSDYVQASTALGYACTIHAAQGVTADTVHGIATGSESRQQLYTMLTRGRRENHVHLVTVGTGDEHDILDPDVAHPRTAVEMLETVLGRDDGQRSATSARRDEADPATRLGGAVDQYLDGLQLAAEHVLRDQRGPDVVDRLEQAAEHLEPGLVDGAAWPALRAHLALAGLDGSDPIDRLRRAVHTAKLDGSRDKASVVDWRLSELAPRRRPGPLPWLPPVPASIEADPHWGGYVSDLNDLVSSLSARVADRAGHSDEVPPWATTGSRTSRSLVVDVTLWRAAAKVDPADRRPTGPIHHTREPARWQRNLLARINGIGTAPAEWGHLFRGLAPHVARDPFSAVLAQRLSAVARAGLPAHELLHQAAAVAPLPDDHAAAALWWRMSRHLTPAVASHISTTSGPDPSWETQLTGLVGESRAADIRASRWWPALVANVQHGLERGWSLGELTGADASPHAPGDDECEHLVWRSSAVLVPISAAGELEPPPDPLQHLPPRDLHLAVAAPDPKAASPEPDVARPTAILARAAILRDAARMAGPTREPTSEEIRLMYRRQEEWDQCPATRERLLIVNALAQRFFEGALDRSWVPNYVVRRLGVDVCGDDRFRVGHAPDGWTTLVDHLRKQGVREDELLASGVATLTRTNRLIDRFRDRLTFPIINPVAPDEVLGFVARYNPEHDNTHERGAKPPKYLNTGTTPLFHKGDQLFGAHLGHGSGQADAATPVLVEGPLDAIAVTLASAGRFAGVSPLGTALTPVQAKQLATLYRDPAIEPVIATDADRAGAAAAERDYWLLAEHGLDPRVARLEPGQDPAARLAESGAAALVGALAEATTLGAVLMAEAMTGTEPDVSRAVTVLSTRPSQYWEEGVAEIARHTRVPVGTLTASLAEAVEQWDTQPRLVVALGPTAPAGTPSHQTPVDAALPDAVSSPRLAGPVSDIA